MRRKNNLEKQLKARRAWEKFRNTLLGICPCSCLGSLPSSKQQIETEKELQEFQQLVSFLAAVPLFKKQLPKDELPKVADILVRQIWPVGEKVIEQGHEGKGFFIIMEGEASVVTNDAEGHELDLATLYYMDYFGGHTLKARRPNVATVISKGPDPLVTLCCTRESFEKSGLDKKLRFPRRPAIFDGKEIGGERQSAFQRGLSVQGSEDFNPLSEDELKVVIDAVEHNPHLRARTADLHSSAVAEMAKLAMRMNVEKGEEICKGGELGKKFVVIAEGSFDVIPNALASTHHGFEAVVASRSMTERLVRKQRFLLELMLHGQQEHHEGASLSGLERNMSGNMSPKRLQSPKRLDRNVAPMGLDNFQVSSSSSFEPSPSGRLQNGIPLGRAPTMSWHNVGETRQQLMQTNKWKATTEPNKDHMPTREGRRGSRRKPNELLEHVPEGEEEDEDNPFNVGDVVQRIVIGDSQVYKESGTVLEILEDGPEGEVTVEFDAKAGGKVAVRVTCLRPVQDLDPIATLEPGSCFGELALLYNTRQVATFRARENSVVYWIGQKQFQECFRRSAPHFEDYCKLLDEVHLLNPLLRAERWEVAKKATGLFTFQPGEVVVRQGEIKPEHLWYVIEKNGCTISQETKEGVTQELARLHRGAHFGERQILMGDAASEFTVIAGSSGMVCLVIDGEILQNLPLDVDTILQGDTSQLSTSPELRRDAPEGTCKMRSDLASYVKNLKQSVVDFDVKLQDLELVGVLGEGGFGSVLLASHEGKEYALKRMSKGWVVESNVQRNVAAERDLLAIIDTPFIVSFHRSYRDDQWVYMLLEYCSGGHMLGLMEKHREVLLNDTPRGSASMFYTASVSYALEYLHERNIMYRDLKLENVLLDANGYVKLCDLGFARFVHGKSNTQAGTPDYMAPEVIDPPHAHDSMVDWYALGVLCCELLIGQVPFDDQGLEDIQVCLEAIRMQQDWGIPKGLFGSQLVLAEDFVRKLLVVNPKKRLGSMGDGSEVRSHGWFTSMKFDFDGLLQLRCPTPFQAGQQMVERKLRVSRTVKDHIKIDTDLFRVYEEDMPGNHDPNWDDCFE